MTTDNGTYQDQLRPPFSYYGGKQQMARQIAARLPAHLHYVEPFAGSLAVLLAKPRSAYETVNDLDGDIMLFWRVLRDRTDELMAVAALTPHSRSEYRAAKELDGCDELERARRVWVNLTQGRNGKLLVATGWRFRESGQDAFSIPAYLDAYLGRMPAAARRLRSVSLECRDAFDVIRDYGEHPGVCLYVDPPYDPASRNSTGYRHEMTDPDDHRRLAESLHACRASVVLSGYRSELYDELYADWSADRIPVVNAQGGDKRTTTEVLWSNRELGQSRLFDV
jgi:DNA adenine methylase